MGTGVASSTNETCKKCLGDTTKLCDCNGVLKGGGKQGRANKKSAQDHANACMRPVHEQAYEAVQANCERVAELGEWPPYIPPASLATRIPNNGENGVGGFDAGVACGMDLIPREKQKLAAKLHAAYTPAAVDQVRSEIETMDPDSETTWWLAACSVCTEETATPDSFADQVETFKMLADDPDSRVEAAKEMLDSMRSSYEMKDGIPFAKRDGGMQGAYIDGHDVAAQYASEHDLHFVGTFRETLGLENMEWKEPGNPNGATRDEQMGRSGPIHGSKQFVKCADENEFKRVVATVKQNTSLLD